MQNINNDFISETDNKNETPNTSESNVNQELLNKMIQMGIMQVKDEFNFQSFIKDYTLESGQREYPIGEVLTKFFYRQWNASEPFNEDQYPDSLHPIPNSRIIRTYDFYVDLQRRALISIKGKFTAFQLEHLFHVIGVASVQKYDINFSFREEIYEYLSYCGMPIDESKDFVSVIESINTSEFEIFCNLIIELDQNIRPSLIQKAIKDYLLKKD